MKTAIILCAGKSSRFGTDKLAESFNGHTLPYYAAEFALRNGADHIALTLSRNAVVTDGRNIYHPIVDEIKTLCEPLVCFQRPDTYGAGAAISAWSGVLEAPLWVLFGDNYYEGKLPVETAERLFDRNDKSLWFTSDKRSTHPRNLQLAAIVDGYVIEKPHSFLSGEFFCGFLRLPAGYLNNIGNLRKSDRGEVEVADMINLAPSRNQFDLKQLGLRWGDLTYEQDCLAIRELVRAGQ